MKKEQLTQKEVKGIYENVIKLVYCEIQSLLRGKERKGYTAGMYGWNADVYYFNNVAIVTGYRPFGNIRPDYELVAKYENKAMEINRTIDNYKERMNKLDELLNKFIDEVIEKGGLF